MKMAVGLGYFESFVKIGESFAEEWKLTGFGNNPLRESYDELLFYGTLSSRDILAMLFIGLGFTIMRFITAAIVFKVRLVLERNYLCATLYISF